jgi:DNA polymerase V
MIFHIDGNSFDASCERVFRPDLAKRPIAVLTNNDGIIIALNKECRTLGFQRGDVFFKVRERLQAAGAVVFSSNYTLYADMSARLNMIYHRFAPEVEFYSIDESFLYFPNWKNQEYAGLATTIRDTAKLETGLPVSVGIAPTKTLAKLCNKLSKKGSGICDWAAIDQEKELAAFPVDDIWGIGRAKTKFLAQNRIFTALDLKNYPLDKAKKHLSIEGMWIVQELKGISAMDRTIRDARQGIMCSRSFSGAVYTVDRISAALGDYTQEAVKRLATRYVTVYLMTGHWEPGETYCNFATAQLPRATAFLPDIMSAAQGLLRQIYRKGYPYRKTMVCLLALERERDIPRELFDDQDMMEKKARLMHSFDRINRKYGRGGGGAAYGDFNHHCAPQRAMSTDFALGNEAGIFIPLLYHPVQGYSQSAVKFSGIRRF